MSACPSKISLEQYLLTPDTVPEREHVARCEPCQEKLVRMRAQGDHFRQFVLPANLDSTVDAVLRNRFDPKRWFQWALPVLAMGILAVVLFRPVPGPANDYLGSKGGAGFGLKVFVEHGGVGTPISSGEAVSPNALLRSSLQVNSPCWLWLFSVDEAGARTAIYPPGGETPAQIEGSGELPGGAELDGSQGSERLWAVCTEMPLPWSDLKRATDGLSPRVDSLSNLPPGARQSSVLLEKAP